MLPYIMTRMKVTTVYLKGIQLNALRAISKETGAPMAALIRMAVDEFIARRKAAKENASHGESEGQGQE